MYSRCDLERSVCGAWRSAVLSAMFALFSPSLAAATDVWCSHVTAFGGWKTEISLYASGSTPAQYRVEMFSDVGEALGTLDGTAAAKGWTTVSAKPLGFEGSARVTSDRDLLVKASYQLVESPSVCEFFLTGATGSAWVLPNSVRSWMSYSGIALVNQRGEPVVLTLEAWKNGARAAQDAVVSMGGRHKYVRLSDQVWPGVGYADVDTIVVRAPSGIPAPLLISGNAAGDRNLFFLAQLDPESQNGGDLAAVDPFVGNLRYVPAGSFVQGSPEGEPCREPWIAGRETQFTHTLTKSVAVMETEVTRQMWADLKAAQPSLPPDPSFLSSGTGMASPVQNNTWYEAVLFANLLSAQRGLKPCYYADAAFSEPFTSANYTAGPFYCDWDAGGYRLPTEGEWEYFCRAGTTGPFWIAEPNYKAENCGSAYTPGMYLSLESAAWFYGNSSDDSASSPVGAKAANPWNLKDVHGNLLEWCWDWFASDYPAGAATDFRGPAEESIRVLRGGGWISAAWSLRSASRYGRNPDYRFYDLGFRLVKGQ